MGGSNRWLGTLHDEGERVEIKQQNVYSVVGENRS